MLKIISRPLSKLLNKLGYSITPTYYMIPRVRETKWIQKLDIQTIIDIGANEGQFIKKISSILPDKKIIAFEPIPYCYAKLLDATKKRNVTAYNIGLSDKPEMSEINISKNKESSSILKMKDIHISSYPDSSFISKEKIQLKRLDEVINPDQLKKNILIKLDTQGYEKNAIEGGKNIFSAAAVLLIETVFEPLYEDQWLFEDIYKYFLKDGFRFMGFAEQEYSPKTGIPLFADAIFIKGDYIAKVV